MRLLRPLAAVLALYLVTEILFASVGRSGAVQLLLVAALLCLGVWGVRRVSAANTARRFEIDREADVAFKKRFNDRQLERIEHRHERRHAL